MKLKLNVKKRKLIIVAIVFVLAIALIPPLRNSVIRFGGTILSPLTSCADSGSDGVSGWFYSVTHADDIYEDNQKLQKKLDDANNRLATYKGLDAENERLRKLLEISEKYEDIESTGAEIIAKGAGNWFSTFTINKGSSDGVKPNQPVLYAGALVGHTTNDVGSNWAKVVGIIDTNHAVTGKVVRNGDYVLVEGNLTLMHDGKCKMTNITENADVVAGDTVVTSGLGGVYPEGIVIGTVDTFVKSNAEDGNYAIIKPAVDFQRIQEVLVLKTEDDV